MQADTVNLLDSPVIVEYKAEPWHCLTTCVHCADCTTASGEGSFQDVRGCEAGCLAGGQGPINIPPTDDFPLITSPLTQGAELSDPTEERTSLPCTVGSRLRTVRTGAEFRLAEVLRVGIPRNPAPGCLKHFPCGKVAAHEAVSSACGCACLHPVSTISETLRPRGRGPVSPPCPN